MNRFQLSWCQGLFCWGGEGKGCLTAPRQTSGATPNTPTTVIVPHILFRYAPPPCLPLLFSVDSYAHPYSSLFPLSSP